MKKEKNRVFSDEEKKILDEAVAVAYDRLTDRVIQIQFRAAYKIKFAGKFISFYEKETWNSLAAAKSAVNFRIRRSSELMSTIKGSKLTVLDVITAMENKGILEFIQIS